MSLAPYETELVGRWEMVQGRMIEDEASRRIKKLVREELKSVAKASNGWDSLFRDPADGRLWELTYPSSELQGGGPPTLRIMSEEAAHKKYGL
jgi:immunity protein 27 of polymorphic toxin system